MIVNYVEEYYKCEAITFYIILNLNVEMQNTLNGKIKKESSRDTLFWKAQIWIIEHYWYQCLNPKTFSHPKEILHL